MKIGTFQKVKARRLHVGDSIIMHAVGIANGYMAMPVREVVENTKRLANGERQTAAHRMRVRTDGKTYQMLPTTDVFILPRIQADKPRRGRPKGSTKKAQVKKA